MFKFIANDQILRLKINFDSNSNSCELRASHESIYSHHVFSTSKKWKIQNWRFVLTEIVKCQMRKQLTSCLFGFSTLLRLCWLSSPVFIFFSFVFRLYFLFVCCKKRQFYYISNVYSISCCTCTYIFSLAYESLSNKRITKNPFVRVTRKRDRMCSEWSAFAFT